MSKREVNQNCPREIAMLLAQELDAEAPTAERGAALKRRLLARVHEDVCRGSETVRALEGQWHIFLPGIRIKMLHQGGGRASYLLKLEPGAILPPHRHPVVEECVVLEGSLRTRHRGREVVVGGRGTFHCAPAGVAHEMLTSDSGALIFLRGAAPVAKDIDWRGKGALRAMMPTSLRAVWR
jgi:quercetin dioxygenase-like cupin family protein